MAVFRPGHVPGHSDGRLNSPTFPRNHEPVTAALVARLADMRGYALEIGSGTGEHVQGFAKALPNLHWQPSDPDPLHRASIDAWSAATASNLSAALDLDASKPMPALLRQISPLAAMFSMNVIHIAPWSVAQGIVQTAAQTLMPGGWLGFYGPFRQNGQHISESNARFDAGLRADNPDWGVRDISDLAALAQTAGLSAPKLDPMPANNHILWFQAPVAHPT